MGVERVKRLNVEVDEPLNSNERYLYSIAKSLEYIVSYIEDTRSKEGMKEEEVKQEVNKEVEGQMSIDEIDVVKIDYNILTKNQIMIELDKKGIKYNNRLSKSKLIELL